MDKVKIIVDTKGADGGAAAIIKGALLALGELSSLSVVLVGDGELIGSVCAELGAPMERVEIIDATGEITNYDSAAEAIYKKTDSSMLTALSLLGERDDLFGMLSAGNTGVLLAGAMRHLSKRTRQRPLLAAVLPSQTGGFTCVADTGATIDTTPAMLSHFARLGSRFMKDAYGIENPRVALLSNGTESSKGNKLVKETYPLLEADESVNFVGNAEGSNALSGVCDVLVCDGFDGNLVLKVTEGTAARIITDIMKYAKRNSSAEIAELGRHLMKVYDISSLGGGIILGVDKPVIKMRGSAGEQAVVNTAGMLINMARGEAVFDAAKNKI